MKKVFKLGDKVRIVGLHNDEALNYGIIKHFDLSNDEVEVQWRTIEGKKTCPFTHHYRIQDLIPFGKKRTGHHLTNIFK